MRQHLWKNQKGSIAVLVSLIFPVLVGFGGLALDIGNLCVVKTKMQNAVDAAAYAGGLKLPNTAQATAQAKSLVQSNNFDPNTVTVNFNQDPVKNPGNAPQINCSMTNNVPTFFMGLLGLKTVPLTASAESIAISQSGAGGPFNYTIFSGSELDILTLNGSETIKGSVHSDYRLTINGCLNISQAAEGAHGVIINGSNTISSVVADTVQNININGSNTIGSKSGGATEIDMPDYSQQIADIAAQVYNSDKTFDGAVNIAGNIYVKGKVTLNGSVSSTGAILATGSITVNGTSSISTSSQVCLYSQNGNITVNGTSFIGNTSSAILYAPKGTAIINGYMNFHGRIIAKKVIINGSGNYIGDDYPVTSLPVGKLHVKLIR